MAKYLIGSADGKVFIGSFCGKTPEEALDTSAREQGYADFDAVKKELPGIELELVVIRMDRLSRWYWWMRRDRGYSEVSLASAIESGEVKTPPWLGVDPHSARGFVIWDTRQVDRPRVVFHLNREQKDL